MDDLAELRVERFLNQLADRSPTPGGGGATALVGALGCALARMVATYSIGDKTEQTVRARVEAVLTRLHRADELTRALITQDAVAYNAMTEAARAARKDPSARSAFEETVLAAIAVPMEMAALASNALAAMDELKVITGKYMLSDLGISAVLADATVRAARYTVHVNVPELADDTRRAAILSEIDRIMENSARLCESIERFVQSRLETRPGDSR